MTAIPGLHHVTAICSGPQDNMNFYTRTLSQLPSMMWPPCAAC